MSERTKLLSSLASSGRTLRFAVAARAVADTIFLAVAYLLAVYALDRTFDFQSITRQILGVGLLAGFSLLVLYLAVLPAVRAYRMSDLALIAERSFPQFNGMLVTVVELDDNSSILQFLAREASSVFDKTKKFTLVNSSKVLKRVGISSCAILVIVVLSLVFPAEAGAFLARLTGKNVSYPEIPAFKVNLDEHVRIAEGSSLLVRVEVINGFSFRSVMLNVESSQSSTRIMNNTDENSFELLLEDIYEPLILSVSGNGKTSGKYFVEVVARPSLASLHIEIVPPSYTGLKKTSLMGGQGNIRVLVSSRITALIIATRELRSASLMFGDGTVKNMLVKGVSAQVEFEAFRDDTYTLGLVDNEGFESMGLPQYRISIIPDKAPTVNIDSPKANRKVTPDGAFRLKCKIRDDFGLSSVRIFLRPENDERRENSFQLAIPANRKEIDLNEIVQIADLKLNPGETFLFWLDVRDNKPDPNVILTSPITLRAVRPYELLEEIKTFLAAAKERLRNGIEVENEVIVSVGESKELRASLIKHRQIVRDLATLVPDIEQVADDFRLNRLGEEEANLLGSVASGIAGALSGYGLKVSSGLAVLTGLTTPDKAIVTETVKASMRFRDALNLQLQRLGRFENYAEVLRELRQLIGKQEELRDKIRDIIERRFGQ